MRNHWTSKKALEERISDSVLISVPQDNTRVQGKKSDPTANAGIRLASDTFVPYLRNCVRAVEETLFEFADHENGAAVVMLVKLIYWENRSLESAAYKVNYSYVHAQRLREDFVNELVRRLGWSDAKENI